VIGGVYLTPPDHVRTHSWRPEATANGPAKRAESRSARTITLTRNGVGLARLVGQSQMTSERIAVIGAGGHASVVASTLVASGHTIAGFFDDDPRRSGTTFCNAPMLGTIADAATSRDFSRAILGVGRNDVRKRLAEELDLDWMSVVHPFAWVDPSASLGVGSVVFAGAIVQANAQVGVHVILNTRASVDHDCVVGDYVHIAVAHLGGSARADEGAFLALGSVVLPGLRVGAWATVGAGAVVTKDVAPGTIVVGAPARPVPGRAAS
jgi:acetyltransferase EpsM